MAKFKQKLVVLLMFVGLVTGFFASALATTTNPVKAATIAQQIEQVNAKLSKAEKRAKEWIAYRESRGLYFVSNGKCFGRYQLLKAYLKGDYTRVNQEKTANKYVKGRYGSWVKAKKFWQSHHWY